MPKLTAERAAERALEASLNHEPWAKKVKKALTPEEKAEVQKRTHLKQLAGRELDELRSLPPMPVVDKAIAKGPLLERALTDPAVEWKLAPLARKAFSLLCAYADGEANANDADADGDDGDSCSPTVSVLAARMAQPVPIVLHLLHKLEIRGWISVEWSPDYETGNVYTIVWPDAE